MENIPYIGEIYALLTALIWAFAVVMFKKSGETVHPIALNLFKNVMAVILYIPTIYIMGETIFRIIPTNHLILLIISGIFGIGLGDTLYFKSLNKMGAGMIAVVACFYSPSIIFLSYILHDERLTLIQILGALLIISAVLIAGHKKGRGHLDKKTLLIGASWGASACIINGISIVMIKPLLDLYSVVWVVEVLLLAGVIVLLLFLLFNSKRFEIISTLKIKEGMKYTLIGSFSGAYLAMFFWIAGMKYTLASIAAVLNQTSNLFIFVFAAIFLRERINLLRSISIALAIAGAVIVSIG